METTTPFRGNAVPSGACALLTTVMPFGVPTVRTATVLGGLVGSAPISGPLFTGADRRYDRHGVTSHRATPRHLLLTDHPVNGTSLRAIAPAGPAAPPDRRSTHPGDHT